MTTGMPTRAHSNRFDAKVPNLRRSTGCDCRHCRPGLRTASLCLLRELLGLAGAIGSAGWALLLPPPPEPLRRPQRTGQR